MACRTGLVAEDCIADHFLPPLKGRAERSGSRAPCPVCGSPRAISIQAKNNRPVWNQHCECERDVVSKSIAGIVACYQHAGRRTRKPQPDLELLQALLLDQDVPGSALRLGCLRAIGMPEKEIRENLGLPRRTYYFAVQWLAQNRRSR